MPSSTSPTSIAGRCGSTSRSWFGPFRPPSRAAEIGASTDAGTGRPTPLVSICIPTYDGAQWVADAIRSALAQDYDPIEIVVCDDASRDGTVAAARQIADGRIVVVENAQHVGMAANWNRAVQASRGDYVKFLMQDDELGPDCIARMVAVLETNPSVGLVFSPRTIRLDEPSDPESATFLRKLGTLHGELGPLADRNDGRRVFDRIASSGFRRNWIGEPTVVMVRRDALRRVGLFNTRVRQLTDLEMWLRIAFFTDVGFVGSPLATFRVHRRSASTANARTGVGWLDRAWMLEGLRAHPEIRAALRPRTELLVWAITLRAEMKRALLNHDASVRSHARDLTDYLKFRRHPSYDVLHGRLDSG